MTTPDSKQIRHGQWVRIAFGFVIFALLMATIPHISGMWFRAATAGVAGGFFGVALNAIHQLQRGS